jgi:hypothetical protein
VVVIVVEWQREKSWSGRKGTEIVIKLLIRIERRREMRVEIEVWRQNGWEETERVMDW